MSAGSLRIIGLVITAIAVIGAEWGLVPRVTTRGGEDRDVILPPFSDKFPQ